ncbi:MAG: glucuronyl esterase domain-containing protein [Armatimonadota bacterium]
MCTVCLLAAVIAGSLACLGNTLKLSVEVTRPSGTRPTGLVKMEARDYTRTGDTPGRETAMQTLLRMLPKSEAWEQWLHSSGEAPPDFGSMPSIPGLPDPLQLRSEVPWRRLRGADEWDAKRKEVLAAFDRYIVGKAPPSPGNVQARVVSTSEVPGAVSQHIELRFGPNQSALLGIELLTPKGTPPFPVFLTQHNHRGWAVLAVRRGYMACVYNAADSKDDTERFAEVYPEYDWSALRRRAWAASRCIDYLQTLPTVDASRIVITGHSRNGKQSLIAAAYDERISAVISSSSGAGGSMPYRLFSETHFGEGIELLTRVFPHWFHPRLRFFVGREDKLPTDNNELIAVIAPRACLLSTALNDPVESTWATQMVYLSALRAYEFLGHPERLAIRWRPGSHETNAEDIEAYLDWCDAVFGRSKLRSSTRLLHPTSFSAWRRLSRERVRPTSFPAAGIQSVGFTTAAQWPETRRNLAERLRWLFGDEPPEAPAQPDSYGAEPAHVSAVLGRGGTPSDIDRVGLSFGEYVSGHVYLPKGTASSGKKICAVLWLHPYSFSNGYTAGYRRGEQPYITIARHGFAVFCFDMIGFGTRIEEGERFYSRTPRWSLMGRMVRDARAAVSALRDLPFIDPDRVFCVGYGLGGMVALFASALDDRIAGAVSVCGFTPLRTDVAKGTGGLARYSDWLVLMPRLGFFIGHEDHVPVDFHEVLALIAPRRVLVVAPTLDREARLDDVRTSVRAAAQVYAALNAREAIELVSPYEYNRFGPESQAVVAAWLKRVTAQR